MSRRRILIINLWLCLIFAASFSFAANAFVVKAIKVEGLHRIPLGTALNYIPIEVGQTLSEALAPSIIHSLYGTGFFSDVSLAREGDTLIIKVVERPTIGYIHSSGNKDIPEERFKTVLRSAGLIEGEVFKRSTLEELSQSLKQEYNNRGKYNARIETTVTDMSRNRVRIEIDVSEGSVARIKEINIIGNQSFATKELMGTFELSPTNLISLIRRRDRYSKESLAASLEGLKSFYLDRGFIHFKVESTQVSLTPDRKFVYITVKIQEGPRYKISSIHVTGKTILPEERIRQLILVKPGEYFSRKAITDSSAAIGLELGNLGYGFPDINTDPQIDEKNKTISLTFLVNAGRKVAVRRIVFTGNVKTADYVLRREMQQNEGQVLSLGDIKESERRLRILGYFKNVQVKTEPVPGTNDQIDLNFQVEETTAGEASASVGYGGNGVEFNARVNQRNFFGTGRTVGVDFTTNNYGRYYSFNYFNPYHTISGIGVGFEGYFQDITPRNEGISNFSNRRAGGMVSYTIPINTHNSLHAGWGYEYLALTLGDNAATQSISYVAMNGNHFNQIRLKGGWTYDNYDQFPFPTKGVNQKFNFMFFPVIANALTEPNGQKHTPSVKYFYNVDYKASALFPISHGFIFGLQGVIGYGSNIGAPTTYPFFENYYAGGTAAIGRVRGFNSYTLGPRDSNDLPLGGNFVTAGTASLILPYPFSRESFRTSLFVDAGNVYSVGAIANQGGSKPGPIRFGAGVGVDWQSFIGPLAFSLAQPLNRQCRIYRGEKRCDDNRIFDFTFSMGF